MEKLSTKIDKLLLSLVGIALILVSLLIRDIEYIAIPLAIVGLTVCILASPLLKTKEEKGRDRDSEQYK